MPTKKQIITIGVLCVISLGLGYWYGMPKEGSGGGGNGRSKEPKFLKQGLVAYYPFNGNAKDETTNNYHGLLEGPTSATNRFGQPNQAIAFDGAKDGVSLPNQVFNGLEAFTFATWINLDTPKASQTILSLANSRDDGALYVMFIRGIFTVAITRQHREALSVPLKSFVHRSRQIVVAHELSEASIKVYIDGELKSNLAYTKTGPLIVDPGGAWLGQEQDSVGGGFDPAQALKGSLDDIRIYNRALSEAEVKALYDFEKPKTQQASTAKLKEKITGTYERKEGAITERLVSLDNGAMEHYVNGGKTSTEWKWSLVDKEIHLDRGGRTSTLAYRINPDDSITAIASITNGKRTDLPNKGQLTYIKIK